MSDREGAGFDQLEMAALAATFGGAGYAVADSLGRAVMWAHVLWRRRAGSLAALPAAG